MTTFIKFKLSPGQMKPPGSTNLTVSGSEDYFVWVGETEKDFNKYSYINKALLLDTDPEVSEVINYKVMTEEEIAIFKNDAKKEYKIDYDKAILDGIYVSKQEEIRK